MGQMVSFAAMLAVGFLCARAGIVERTSLGPAIGLSTKVFLPAMLFSTVCRRVDQGFICSQLPMAGLTALFYPVVIAVVTATAHLLRLDGSCSRAFRMAFIFGNTGFIGLPVLVAAFPATGAANLVLFTLVDQVVFWTYGITLAGGEKTAGDWKERIKGILNPNVVAIAAALACRAAGVPVSDAIIDFTGTIGAAATPLCMVCLGAMCSLPSLAQVVRSRDLWAGVLVKMVALALAVAAAVKALPVASDIATSMILMAGMPPTTLVPLVIEANGGDGDYACALSVAAIALAAATLPLVAFVTGA